MRLFFCFVFVNACVSVFAQQSKTVLQFNVSDVKMAQHFLKTDSAAKVVETKLGYRLLFMPPAHRLQCIVYRPNNNFIQTIQECYDEHRPLQLSPDAVWLLICQGVSIHINKHIDSLRPIIFKSQQKVELRHREDSLEYSAASWERLTASLSTKTVEYTKSNFYNSFVPKFSTTTAIHTTAYQITLMEGLKKGFTYVGESGCGIPSIKLSGTKKDWEWIYAHVSDFDQLGLSYWTKELKPIIAEFVNAYDGGAKPEFWQDIYKKFEEYNAFYISGWIIKFFPYIKQLDYTNDWNEEQQGTKAYEIYSDNPYVKGYSYYQSTLSTGDFPEGISKVDLKWENFIKKKEKNMLLMSGFMGIYQYEDKTLEPFVSWAVCDKSIRARKFKLPNRNFETMAHPNNNLWSPHIAKDVTSRPIYDIKSNKDYATSKTFVINYLENAIRAEGRFSKELKHIKLSFIVNGNGKVSHVEIKGHRELQQFAETKLMSLPASWLPAMTKMENVVMILEPDPALAGKLVKANYQMELVLFP